MEQNMWDNVMKWKKRFKFETGNLQGIGYNLYEHDADKNANATVKIFGQHSIRLWYVLKAKIIIFVWKKFFVRYLLIRRFFYLLFPQCWFF